MFGDKVQEDICSYQCQTYHGCHEILISQVQKLVRLFPDHNLAHSVPFRARLVSCTRAGPGRSDACARVWLAGQNIGPDSHSTQSMKDAASRETPESAASSEPGSRSA
jgi:hypothetical protein